MIRHPVRCGPHRQRRTDRRCGRYGPVATRPYGEDAVRCGGAVRGLPVWPGRTVLRPVRCWGPYGAVRSVRPYGARCGAAAPSRPACGAGWCGAAGCCGCAVIWRAAAVQRGCAVHRRGDRPAGRAVQREAAPRSRCAAAVHRSAASGCRAPQGLAARCGMRRTGREGCGAPQSGRRRAVHALPGWPAGLRRPMRRTGAWQGRAPGLMRCVDAAVRRPSTSCARCGAPMRRR